MLQEELELKGRYKVIPEVKVHKVSKVQQVLKERFKDIQVDKGHKVPKVLQVPKVPSKVTSDSKVLKDPKVLKGLKGLLPVLRELLEKLVFRGVPVLRVLPKELRVVQEHKDFRERQVLRV